MSQLTCCRLCQSALCCMPCPMGLRACLFPWPLSPGEERGRRKCAAFYLGVSCLSCSQAEGSDFFSPSLSFPFLCQLIAHCQRALLKLQKLHFLVPELLIFSWLIAVTGGQIRAPESLGCFGFDLESFFCSPHHKKQSFDHCRHVLKKTKSSGQGLFNYISGDWK